jgi:outer membrane protein OmpA-like peptidoglycan-associated protein
MSFNLIDSVKGYFTSNVVSEAASKLGESESGIQKALSAAIPSALAGMLSKAGSGGSSDILDMAKQAAGGGMGNILSGIGSTGGGLLKMLTNLFGDKLGGIVRMIANFAGIKESSASAVMGMAAPATLAAVGDHAVKNNLSTGGLLSFLNSQKDSILSAVPSGLNLAGALGLGSLGDIGRKLSGLVSGAGDSMKKVASSAADYPGGVARKGRGWVLPLLLIAAVAIGAWWLLGKGCGKNDATVSTENTAPVIQPAAESPAPSYIVRLPDGVELSAFKGGIEDKLVYFLSTNWKALSDDSLKNTWFDFDNLNFETGSARLTSESMKQVNNIVAIMKAFPDAKIKIGGYTDKVGNDAGNKKLSQERADAVTEALKSSGADAARLVKPEGYGEEFARIPETASDEERKVDRRISVGVRK